MRRLKRLWQQSKQSWQQSSAIVKLGIILLIVIFIFIAGDYAGLRFFNWAGVSDYTKPSDLYVSQKTMWDWLQLLIIPAVLAVAALWFNQHEREAERRISDQRLREATLQAYLNRMTELLLEKGLRTSGEDDEERAVARARTLTALHQLDEPRKGTLIRFLYEGNLINKDDRIVDLDGADLEKTRLLGANLSEANLSGADLSEAVLRSTYLFDADLKGAVLFGADLSEAGLDGADLHRADLSRADLSRAHLREADLRRVDLSEADLREADLREANLSNSKYDDQTVWPEGFTPPPDAINIEE